MSKNTTDSRKSYINMIIIDILSMASCFFFRVMDLDSVSLSRLRDPRSVDQETQPGAGNTFGDQQERGMTRLPLEILRFEIERLFQKNPIDETCQFQY